MVEISIIILVKNGEAYLEQVLNRVFSQKEELELEVLAIDSGSRDRSKEILRRFPVRLQEIAPVMFNHGETRNLGASLSRGAYLVYLTQDAIPGDETWLEKLVEPLREDPQVAGAFSSHRPRKDCHLMERRQILQTELVAGKTRRVNSAVGNLEFEKNPYPFVWFSNTSSCLRREVWEKIPFGKVAFAEDQDWAERVLKSGYKTVYVPDSIVIHSHNYRPVKNFKRHFEHAKAMKEIFGKKEVPLFKTIFLATRDSVRADFQFYRAEGGRKAGFLRWFFPSLFWYLSAFGGLWLGTYPEKIPARWRDRLTLQSSIIEQ